MVLFSGYLAHLPILCYSAVMKLGIDCIGVTVTFFCHDGQGNIIFVKRSEKARDEHGRWDIGGGAIDFGDKVEDTLKKEIKEEYCTDVLDYEFLGYRDAHRIQNGIKTQWISLDFKVLVDRNKAKNGEPEKFTDFGWFTLDTRPEPLHSMLPEFFAKYENKLRE